MNTVDDLVRALDGQRGYEAYHEACAFCRYRKGDEIFGTDLHRSAAEEGLVENRLKGRGRNRKTSWHLTPVGEQRARALREQKP